MLALPAAIETLPTQHSLDLRRQQILLAIALFPSAAKSVCIVAAAVEAGTVAGGEGRGLIEKEQLGPAAAVITLRRRPRNSSTQVSRAGVDQRFFKSVLVAGSWMIPRLPTNRPRSVVAMMSPVGA